MKKTELKKLIKEYIQNETNVPNFGGPKMWMYKDDIGTCLNFLSYVLREENTKLSDDSRESLNAVIDILQKSELIRPE